MDDLLIISEPRPNRADALKNRELLLVTARRLFAERGVEGVPMSAVAEAAGVGKGTLYRNFANKVELCTELLDHDQRDLQERSLKRLREGYNPSANLLWFMNEVFNFVIRNQELLLVGAGHIPTLDHPAHLWWRQTIRGLLAQIKPALNLDYLADLLYLMLDVRSIRFQRRLYDDDVLRMTAHMNDAIRKLIS